MTSRVHVELEASRSDSEPRPISITAPAEASAGAVLDALGAHLGLAGAAGAVQARSLVSGHSVDRGASLRDVGLLRGERLSLTVGLTPSGPARELVRWPEWRGAADDGCISLNRPPRAVHDEPALSVAVPAQRTHRPPRRFPLGAILIPVAIGAILVLVVRRWEIALFALFTPVMVAWNYVEERRGRADELREYGRTYDEDVRLTFEQVQAVATAWGEWMLRHHPSPQEVFETATRLTSRLWERNPGDPDFLRLRVGRGTRSAPVTFRNDGAGPAARLGEPDFAASAVVPQMPVTVDLAESTGVAVVAKGDQLDRVAAWLVAQVVTLHSPADVLVAGVLTDQDSTECWRWLPHVARGWISSEPLTDAVGADELLDAVVQLAEQRRAARDRPRGGAGAQPAVVVFVDGRARPDRARLSEVLEAHDVGIVTIWLGDDPRAAPSTVSHLLDMAGDVAELVTMRGGGRSTLMPEQLSRSSMLDLSASLAPVRDAADPHRVTAVPDRVALEDLIGDLAAPAGMRRRWEQAPITHLTARLGLTEDGPFELELGPLGSHALVGGTTGSGKSELLQTMVSALAASYPPSRVGFLLVDYKGGAAFKDAMRLPHCVGVVTDLDDHLTHRVMVALDAEIKRREGLLAGGGARDLTELRRTRPESAPGDLVIVVDEFATLAKEIPAFVEGVVDIAARGRSLGLRLVLATQRPAGVINDRIRANVGVRIALRVNDEADSMDVIDSREAAHIPRSLAGRAFARVDRALTEFQSAFVGAPVREGADAAIDVRDLWGSSRAASAGSTAAVSRTVLEELVASADKVARLGQWQPPHVPWLPALVPVLPLTELTTRAPEVPAASVVLGLADLPEQQDQRVVAFDLAHHQNMLVFGTSRSGKTTVLRTLAAGFIDSHGPEQVTVAGLDFAGHGLHVLEGAPQVVGIVGPDDIGRVGRLLRRLAAMAEQRKRLMATHGLATFAELAARADVPVPRVLVLLDGYAGATAALERVDGGRLLERLERLIPDGPGVGLHFVVTADRRAAVPSALDERDHDPARPPDVRARRLRPGRSPAGPGPPCVDDARAGLHPGDDRGPGRGRSLHRPPCRGCGDRRAGAAGLSTVAGVGASGRAHAGPGASRRPPARGIDVRPDLRGR